jgi:ABC-2 type transport system permease protein
MTLGTQVGQIARRSVVRTLRQPAAVVFPLIFPVALLAVTSAGLNSATRIPGFPSDSFLAFFLAFAFIQGALFATMTAGTDLARDVQSGFLNRLALTPMRGVALIAGQLAGIATMGFVQAVFYLSVGLAFGVRPESGVVGIVVLLILATTIAIAFGALGAFFALRTGSGEAVQGLFPLLFVCLFLSSMNLPRNLIEIDWFRYAATVNPVSYLIEGIRSLIITGWDWRALALAFGFATLIGLASLALGTWALRLRLTRT